MLDRLNALGTTEKLAEAAEAVRERKEFLVANLEEKLEEVLELLTELEKLGRVTNAIDAMLVLPPGGKHRKSAEKPLA